MKSVEFHPIGIIRTPFKEVSGMPIQAAAARGVKGRVEVSPAHQTGLKDLSGFSHIILLYHFHRIRESKLTVTPFLDSKPRGVFATRAPCRPNPIGLSVVKLTGIKGNVLTVENVDMLDGTPLLDIKPYVPEFDHPRAKRIGWLSKAKRRGGTKLSDMRFAPRHRGARNGKARRQKGR
jgi:tRNA-Thr(GGU) m(6)t(6)A37 methyltransferase TsaA